MKITLETLKRYFKLKSTPCSPDETVLGVSKESFEKALPFAAVGSGRSRFPKSYGLRLPKMGFSSHTTASLESPVSQLCTARQFQERVYSNLCGEIHEPPRFHRKQWEFAYILQVLKKHGKLAPGSKGLGFGCGREPLPAVFCKYGCKVLVTDLAQENAVSKGWKETSQYTGNLDQLYEASQRIIDQKSFYDRITYREVDMNNVPRDFDNSFDFVWSACSLEHLGSLQAGIDFIYASLRCLRSGGVAVHTTEFNLSSNTDTVENDQVCLYREKDILGAIEGLPKGCSAVQLNLDAGDSEIDAYVDVPRYLPAPHLKMLLEKYVTTSIGLILTKD